MFDIICDDDPATLATLCAIILTVGSNVASEPAFRLWGKRAAALAYVVFCIYAGIALKPSDAEGWLHIAFRGLFAAAMTLAIVWMALPLVSFAYTNTTVAIVRWTRERITNVNASVAAGRERRRMSAERERALREHQRNEPERERARLEAEEATRVQASEQHRRDESRATCEGIYHLVAPDIGSRFPREQFEKFIQAQMGDEHSADYVERRAAQLQDLLRQHLEKVVPLSFRSLDELREWYETEQKRIEPLPDDVLKRTLQVKLKQRFAELANQLLEGLKL